MMLPRPIVWLVRAVVPAHRADTVLADLEHDHSVRAARSRSWLARETASLTVAYALARLRTWHRIVPLLVRDCQIVARGCRRGAAPLFAASALLGVGVAAVLVTTGLVDALLLRHVSSTHGEALRRIVALDRQGRAVSRFSFPELQQIREHTGDAGPVAAVYLNPIVLRVNNIEVQTMAEVVDGPYFELTGTRPVIGRVLLTADDRPGAPPVAVLAAPFWRRHFAASPGVLGSTVHLNGATFTVVGVAAALGSSTFFGASVDAWVAVSHADPLVNPGWRSNVGDRWFTVFVLPADRMAGPIIDRRLATAAEALAQVYGDPWRERRLHTGAATVLIGSQRSAAMMLAVVLGGLATLILLAAGSNVGGVLIARAAANQRAAAIHMSIGAGRAVIVRRQVIEGAAIGLAAGVLGLALYAWVRAELAQVAILPTLALRLELPLSLEIVALALVAATLIGGMLAIAPALWSTRVDVAHALQDGDGRSGGRALAANTRRVLVSTQVCLTLVLIVGATLFVRSFNALAGVDLGFPRERLVAMDFDVEPVVRNARDLPVLAREALTRVSRLPEVTSAAMSNRAPVDQSTPAVDVQRPGDAASRVGDVGMYLATEDYFATVGVPIVAGRAFTPAEVSANAAVIIVNEAMAARFWPEGDAINRALEIPYDTRALRVVGVARDSKYRTLTESARPHIYRPTAPALGLTLLARARADARETLRAIQRELDSVGPGVTGFFPRTLDDHLAVQLLPTRAAASAASLLGVFALLLSGMALYALVAWFVVLRRREIGVRMALGASSGEVRRLVVRQALIAAWPGVTAGTLVAIGLSVAARAALFGVSPADPVALGVGIGALALVVLIAGYVPSRIATQIDPATALRN